MSRSISHAPRVAELEIFQVQTVSRVCVRATSPRPALRVSLSLLSARSGIGIVGVPVLTEHALNSSFLSFFRWCGAPSSSVVCSSFSSGSALRSFFLPVFFLLRPSGLPPLLKSPHAARLSRLRAHLRLLPLPPRQRGRAAGFSRETVFGLLFFIFKNVLAPAFLMFLKYVTVLRGSA